MAPRKINFSLPAINETSSGFSPRAGYPIIKFTVPSQQALLETVSLRLRGRFQVRSDSSTIVSPNTVGLDNIGDEADSAQMTSATAVTIPIFGGVKCAIDKVIIQSKKTQAELTSVTNYSQYLSLRESRFGIKSDFRNSLPCRSFSLGENAPEAQRRFMISDNSNVTQDQDKGQEFTIKLDVDLFQNKLLHLGEDYLGGLQISLYLAPESAFFATFQNGVATAQTTSISAYRYVLQDLRLEGRYVVPDADMLKQYSVEIQMDDQINLLQDVHSSRSATQITPQAQFVKGITSVFLLQDQTNNFNQSQYSFVMPPGVREVNQSKNNARYPLKFPMKSVPNYATRTAEDVVNYSYPALANPAIEVRLQFERALRDGLLPAFTSATLALTNDVMAQMELAQSGASPTTSTNLAQDSVGVGIDYTAGIGLVQSFRNQDYTLLLDSGVNTQNGNLLDSYADQSLLQQIFVRNNALFNTQTLVKSQ